MGTLYWVIIVIHHYSHHYHIIIIIIVITIIKEPLEESVCDICLASEVEDEVYSLLDCGVYDAARERCDDIFRSTEHKLDVTLMSNDRSWMMDVLIGHGLKKFRQEILRAMKYLA